MNVIKLRQFGQRLEILLIPVSEFGQPLLSFFSPQIDFATLSWARIMQVVAMPFIFIPVSASSYIGLPPERSADAAALFTANIAAVLAFRSHH